MDSEKKADSEYRFFKWFTGEDGEYQYKFRLGPGEWWATDDSKPMVDDGSGNKNNLLVVKATPASGTSAPTAPTPADQPRVTSARSVPQPKDVPELPKQASISEPVAPAPTSSAQAPKTETTSQSAADSALSNKPHGIQLPGLGFDKLKHAHTPAPAPAMAHEVVPEPHKAEKVQNVSLPSASSLFATLASPAVASPAVAPLMKHEYFTLPTQVRDQRDAKPEESDHGDEHGVEHDGPPLLQHESLAPASEEQTQAPLMRYESMALGHHKHDADAGPGAFSPSVSSLSSSHSSMEHAVAPEPGPNDHSLEHFPSDQDGIFAHIRRASMTAAEDEVRNAIKGWSKSPPASGQGSPLASLPSVQEDEDEELAELRAAEYEEYDQERANSEELDPVAEERPAPPLTPPMTPHEADKIITRVMSAIVETKSHTDVKKETHIVADYEQKRGIFGIMADIVMRPMAWFTLAGLVLAVAAGVYKLRYA